MKKAVLSMVFVIVAMLCLGQTNVTISNDSIFAISKGRSQTLIPGIPSSSLVINFINLKVKINQRLYSPDITDENMVFTIRYQDGKELASFRLSEFNDPGSSVKVKSLQLDQSWFDADQTSGRPLIISSPLGGFTQGDAEFLIKIGYSIL